VRLGSDSTTEARSISTFPLWVKTDAARKFLDAAYDAHGTGVPYSDTPRRIVGELLAVSNLSAEHGIATTPILLADAPRSDPRHREGNIANMGTSQSSAGVTTQLDVTIALMDGRYFLYDT
jgi:hypothetical protein